MYIRKLLLTAGILSVNLLFAAEGDYAISKIPAALLGNAHVVKRMEEGRTR